ncbi:unnamed protein product [Ectocarpus fasciculatus]
MLHSVLFIYCTQQPPKSLSFHSINKYYTHQSGSRQGRARGWRIFLAEVHLLTLWFTAKSCACSTLNLLDRDIQVPLKENGNFSRFDTEYISIALQNDIVHSETHRSHNNSGWTQAGITEQPANTLWMGTERTKQI